MSKRSSWELTCRNSPEEVTRARHWTRAFLAGHPAADDAELIVSELASNAVQHAPGHGNRGAFRMHLSLTTDRVVISLTDSGGTPRTPTFRTPAPAEEHGRGLALVQAIAAHVDVQGDHHGHTVTAELTPPPAQPTSHQPAPASLRRL